VDDFRARVVFPNKNHRARLIFAAIIVVMISAAWLSFRQAPSDGQIRMLRLACFLAIFLGSLLYTLSVLSYQSVKDQFEKRIVEVIGATIVSHRPGWPDQAVDLDHLTSARMLGQRLYLRDANGNTIELHRNTERFDELLNRITIPIKRTSSAVVRLWIAAAVTFVSAPCVLFVAQPTEATAIAWILLILLPTALSLTAIAFSGWQHRKAQG
jgi:hypothetical protein